MLVFVASAGAAESQRIDIDTGISISSNYSGNTSVGPLDWRLASTRETSWRLQVRRGLDVGWFVDKILIAAARMVIINASGNNYLSGTRCNRATGTAMQVLGLLMFKYRYSNLSL
jgi:hypothetical protein